MTGRRPILSGAPNFSSAFAAFAVQQKAAVPMLNLWEGHANVFEFHSSVEIDCRCLSLDDFNSAVFGAPVFRRIGGRRRQRPYTVGLEPASAYTVL